MTDNIYYPPSKDELSKALKKRFIWNKDKNKYTDGWCCTFYENVYHLLRKPKGAYTPGEDPIHINNTNFMNEILKIFDKDINTSGTYRVFSNNSLSEEEFNNLVDLMYKLFQDGVAEFISWDRICRQRPRPSDEDE